MTEPGQLAILRIEEILSEKKSGMNIDGKETCEKHKPSVMNNKRNLSISVWHKEGTSLSDADPAVLSQGY